MRLKLLHTAGRYNDCGCLGTISVYVTDRHIGLSCSKTASCQSCNRDNGGHNRGEATNVQIAAAAHAFHS